ncbi:MAG: YfhO family protein [PVC group bacterium]
MKKKLTLLHLWPVLIIIGVMAFMYRDAIFPPYPSWVLSRESGDVASIYYYWRSFGFGSLRAGTIPLWNPDIFCGTPFAAYPESALFYPLNLIFLLLPLPAALNGSFVLHLALLAVFQFFWLRSIGSGRWPSLLGSLALGFSGPVILHLTAGHLSNICTFAWVPLLFLLTEGCLRTGRLRWAAGAGIVLGLQLLAGHWQYAYYTVLLLGIYALCRTAFGRVSTHRRWVFLPAGIVLCLAVAGGLAAVQILPALGAAGESFRRDLDITWASAFSLPPANLLTFILPGYLGDTVGSLYRGENYFWEMCGYLGFIPLLLAMLALILRKDRLTLILALAAGMSLLIALGSYTPLFRGLYALLPGFRYFRGSAKLLFFAAFFLSTLSARGLDCLPSLTTGGFLRFQAIVRRRVIGITAGVLLIVAAGSFIFLRTADEAPPGWWRQRIQADLLRGRHYDIVPPGQPTWWKMAMWETPPERDYPAYVRRLVEETPFPRNSWQTLRLGIRRLAWTSAACALLLAGALLFRRGRWAIAAAIAVLAAVEVAAWARPYLTGFDSRTCLWDKKIAAFFEEQREPFRYLAIDPGDYNRGMLKGFASILGYQANADRRYLEYINASQGLPLRARELVLAVTAYSPLLDLLNTRFVLVPSGMDVETPWFRTVLPTTGNTVWENTRAKPRALVSRRARVIASREEILAALNRTGYRPKDEVILEEPLPEMFLTGEGSAGEARIEKDEPGEVVIRTVLEKPGILLLNDSYAPGWRAEVDGVERKIYRANYLMRAVCLEAGLHTVRFVYSPLPFTIGALISGLILFILVLYFMVIRLRSHFM